jgi:hypothetical protein
VSYLSQRHFDNFTALTLKINIGTTNKQFRHLLTSEEMVAIPMRLQPDAQVITKSVADRAIISTASADQIRIKNRRKRYLDLNPSYFGPDLELAEPLLYDRLIRRFQTAAEREAEGRKKGYSGRLEADLFRSEAKLAALANPDPHATFTYRRGSTGEILAEEKDEIPPTKDEAWERWKYEMERRFLRGDDDDFDYETVDDNEAYDDIEEENRNKLEQYLADESPRWDIPDGKAPEGETGVQDF